MKLSDVARAFVYQDHLGRGWYAYYPNSCDDLDAEGSIPADNFDSKEDAIRYVVYAIKNAMKRPKDTLEGMKSIDVGGGLKWEESA